jgi:hypothetical protein
MRWRNDRRCRACIDSPRGICAEHYKENRDANLWTRHKNGYYGHGIPNNRQFRWELQADELLDQKPPAWWGEDFAIGWAIAVELGRVTGWEPIVMRLSEREWQELKKTSPEFCTAMAPSEEEYDSPRVKELFLQGYHCCHQIIILLKPRTV